MYLTILLQTLFIFLGFLSALTNGFTLPRENNCIHPTQNIETKRLNKHIKFERFSRSSTRCQTQDEHFKSEEAEIIQIFSFDGAIADTSEWCSLLAIDVALKTWPHLQDILAELTGSSIVNHDHIREDQSWLVNKMCALSHVLHSSIDDMMGCEAVLLARLLIEEQSLDLGRSSGCKGKYGSKYHPSESKLSGNDVISGGRDHKNGSRPLTVGEIAINWCDGACVKDTLRAKYHIDFKDPFPTIKENIYDTVHNVSHAIFTNFPNALIQKVFPYLIFCLATNSQASTGTLSNH